MEENRIFIDTVINLTPADLQKNFSLKRVNYPIKYADYSSNDYIYFLFNGGLGYASLNINPKTKSIMWNKFFPLNFRPELNRQGIGTLAHIETTLDIIKSFPFIDPSYIIRHSYSLAEVRILQLKRMGIHFEEGHKEPIAEYVKKIIEYGTSKGFKFTNPFEKS